LRIYGPTPIALQIESDPGFVLVEIAEMFEDAIDESDFSSETIDLVRKCTSRIDLYSCSPTEVHEFEEGGTLVHEPDDINPKDPVVYEMLIGVAKFVDGWIWDNINGGWSSG